MKEVKKAFYLNVCIACLEVFANLWMFTGIRIGGTGATLSASRIYMLRYFTVDSNIFMGIVAVIAAIQLKKIMDGKQEALSKKTYVLILMATAGVTLTMFVTIFYVAVAITHAENGYVLPGYDVYGFFYFGLMSGFIVVPLMTLITYALSVGLYKLNHIPYEFNDAITNEADLLALLKSQQGEMDAVLMYQRLAEKVLEQEVKEILLETAADEGRHGAVFHQLTDVVLKPKKTKAVVVPCLMAVLGKKKIFEIIARQEYAAEDKYEAIVGKYQTVRSVQQDEHMHGDRMMDISKRY